MAGLQDVPENLPVPEDDGAATHLEGMMLADIDLPSTQGNLVSPAKLAGLAVIYAYPMTGRPDTPLPDGWDEIPGARGCTPQSCSFRDHMAELKTLGVNAVFGVSSQTSDYQQEASERLHLPFALLSDAELQFQKAMRLPVMEVAIKGQNSILLKRLALIARDGRIEKVFYPVFPPDRNATDVVDWLANC